MNAGVIDLQEREEEGRSGPSSKLDFRELLIALLNGSSREEIAEQYDCSVRTVDRRLGLLWHLGRRRHCRTR